jgi:tRNA1(Val) A37 N6-methylase TrmN6
MITPPLRMMEVLTAAESTDLKPSEVRFFHSHAEADAYLMQYRWRRGSAADFAVRPPLYVYESERVYSREVAKRLQRERR